ncbi:MAG: ABC transporter permease [Lachnospiraceae bacterium]|nr:ABC transporter permease [Lachnospiraceae bacterium]
MRLYRMELYKLWHKKMFGICAICAVLLVTTYFIGEVQSEFAMVDGERYFGYEAVMVNRQITEEYKGELTDEKITQIVSRYGLPSEIVYGYRGWRDSNYLNGFVTEYLSDGYNRDWNNYKAPTKVYPIEDTELGKLQDMTGTEIVLAYTKGWEIFFDLLQLGMALASALVVISISIVFAQEGQTKMLPLVFTTQEGKDKDVWAKIAAAFTLTIMVYGMTVLLCLGLCFCVFGLDGGVCPMALLERLYIDSRAGYIPVASFAWITLGMDLLAMLLLCAMTMCVSAHCKSNFTAVTTAAVVWCAPLLFAFFGGMGYFFATCMPIFLFMKHSLYESISRGTMAAVLYVAAAVFVICMVEGYQVYRKM